MNSQIPGGAGLSLLALLGGQLLLLSLLQTQLADVLVIKPEYFYFHVLPGVVWPLAGAWLFSAWRARHRPRSTALPLGYSLITTVAVVTGVLTPVYRLGLGQGLNTEQAGDLAWSAGLALTLLIGVSQLLLSLVAPLVLRTWSPSLFLALGSALAGGALAAYLPGLLQQPLLSMAAWLPLTAFALVRLPRPFQLSLAWIVLGVGLMAGVLTGTSFDLPGSSGMLVPSWHGEALLRGLESLLLQPEFLSAVVPLWIVCLARDLLLLGESQTLPHPPERRSALVGSGLFNILGAVLGCGIPLGLLPGFPGFQRWGANQFYCQGAGILLVCLSLGAGAVDWLPLPTLAAVLVVQLLVSGATSLNRLGEKPGYLMAACWLPFLATTGDHNVLLTGLIWGGLALTASSGEFGKAAWVALGGSLLAFTGVLHHNVWNPDFDPVAGGYLLLAVLLRIGWVVRLAEARAVLPPVAGAESGDSSENRSMSAFGIGGDTRSVEGAGSGLLN